MSYLRFDKTLMINLEESLPREILRTNKSGAYHCTTIVDCNTRKYHRFPLRLRFLAIHFHDCE